MGVLLLVGLCDSKISYLYVAFVTKYKILRLDVPMDHIVPVAEFDRLEHLVHVVADLLVVQAVGVLFKNLEQVLLHVLEDHVKTIALLEALNQSDDVLLLEVAQHFHFAQGGLAHDVVVIRFLELFQGNCNTRLLYWSLQQSHTATSKVGTYPTTPPSGKRAKLGIGRADVIGLNLPSSPVSLWRAW